MSHGPEATSARQTIGGRGGVTLLELLITVALAVTIFACIWLAFLHTFRRVRDTLSVSSAIESTVVVVERLGRDVEEMISPPVLGDRPVRISTDGTALSFWVPARESPPDGNTVVATPVTYHLVPDGRGTFHPARDGRPIGGVTLKDWRFVFIEAGQARKEEVGWGSIPIPGSGMWGGDLAEQGGPQSLAVGLFPKSRLDPGKKPGEQTAPSPYAGPLFRWGDDPDLADGIVSAAASLGSTGSSSGSSPATTSTTDPLQHAGPFLMVRVTVVDDGGASIRRVLLFDLVNAHMMGHHGRDFPFPDWVLDLRGELPEFREDPAGRISVPVRSGFDDSLSAAGRGVRQEAS